MTSSTMAAVEQPPLRLRLSVQADDDAAAAASLDAAFAASATAVAADDTAARPTDPLLPGSAPGGPTPTWLGRASWTTRRVLATLFILVLCGAWIALAQTSRAMQQADYKKVVRAQAYFLVWLAHSTYLTFLPMFVGVQWLRRRALRQNADLDGPVKTVELFPWRRYAKQSVILGLLTFAVLYTWYLSLDRTRVAPNTSIYQSACVFVYGFSIYLFGERLTLGRTLAVILCVGGVFMVAFGSPGGADTATESAIGYVLLVASTILYALYEVLYLYLAPDDPDNELAAPLLVLGLIGVVTAFGLWIGMPILHWAGLEVFEWPPAELAAPLVVSMLMESLYNLALFAAILCTSPLFVSIGSMLTVPTALVVDWLLFGYTLTGVAWGGVALITVGYLLLNLLPTPPPPRRRD